MKKLKSNEITITTTIKPVRALTVDQIAAVRGGADAERKLQGVTKWPN